MKDIIIVGAGGFGRELLQWIKDINLKKKTWNIKGFIDDNIKALDEIECDYKIISTIQDYYPKENDVFALAIAAPAIKEKVVGILKSRGCAFATVIHPTAILGEFNCLGEGVIMYPKSEITVNAKIGDFVSVLSCNIGHDVLVGDYATISSWCDITGGVHICKGAYLASGVKVVPGRTIGEYAYVSIGSVVMNNIKAGYKVLGYPARKFMQKKQDG